MAQRFLISLGITVMLLGIFPAKAPAQIDLGERLGRELDEKLSDLSRELREGWQKVETLVDQLGVRGRVYSRVHWDKALASQPIKIDVEDSNIVVLTGRVNDEAAQKKAIQLAEDTLGVSRVIDRLEVVQGSGAAR